jgi:hypothetical protein
LRNAGVGVAAAVVGVGGEGPGDGEGAGVEVVQDQVAVAVVAEAGAGAFGRPQRGDELVGEVGVAWLGSVVGDVGGQVVGQQRVVVGAGESAGQRAVGAGGFVELPQVQALADLQGGVQRCGEGRLAGLGALGEGGERGLQASGVAALGQVQFDGRLVAAGELQGVSPSGSVGGWRTTAMCGSCSSPVKAVYRRATTVASTASSAAASASKSPVSESLLAGSLLSGPLPSGSSLAALAARAAARTSSWVRISVSWWGS